MSQNQPIKSHLKLKYSKFAASWPVLCVTSCTKRQNIRDETKMEQVTPATIMFFITLAACFIFLLPTKIKIGSDLIRFYWRGFWVFLALISLAAGGAETIKLLGYDVEALSIQVLTGIMTSFVLFVVFAWFRLVGVALLKGFRKVA